MHWVGLIEFSVDWDICFQIQLSVGYREINKFCAR
jgi:hypothetical protein